MSEGRSVESDSLQPHGLYTPWNSPGQSTRVGSLSLLQGIFPTQGLNPGLLHYWRILYQPSHKGRPGTLEWVACPSPVSSRPRNRTGVSCIADRFFTSWALRKAWAVYWWQTENIKWKKENLTLYGFGFKTKTLNNMATHKALVKLILFLSLSTLATIWKDYASKY